MSNQLDASIGFKEETVYGTAITVDRHIEFNNETLDYDQDIVQGQGYRQGSRVPRSTRRSVGAVNVGGSIQLDAYSRGMSPLIKGILGTGVSTVIAATTAYQHVFTPGTVADPLTSFTIQKGIPLVGGGAIQPFTYTGMVGNSLEIGVDTGGIVSVNTEWIGKDVLTATAYATPTYPVAANGNIWTFQNGSLVLGGSVTAPTSTALAVGGTTVANVLSANVKWSNNLDPGGRFLGGNGKISRRPVIQYTEESITGQLVFEYSDTVAQAAYLGQTDLALVLTFQGTVAIAAANFPTLQVVVPCVRLDGEIPKTNSGNVVNLTSGFHGLDNGVAASPFYVVLVTADATI